MPQADKQTIAAIEAASGGLVKVQEITAIGQSSKQTIVGTFVSDTGEALGFELVPDGVEEKDRVFRLNSD